MSEFKTFKGDWPSRAYIQVILKSANNTHRNAICGAKSNSDDLMISSLGLSQVGDYFSQNQDTIDETNRVVDEDCSEDKGGVRDFNPGVTTVSDGSVMFNEAGKTMVSVSNAIHPEIQHELQAELDVHIPYSSSDEVDDNESLAALPNDTIACYDAIKDLPYLNACVKEALRIHSTISTGLPRSVPLGRTITVAGQTFKAGSVISVPSYTTNRSSVWGSDANEFRPGRWLESDAGSLNKYFVPFSVGPRACIGRNLAYMDLMLTAATLFRRYEVTALPTTKMTIHDAFVRGVVNCEVGIRRRTAL
ncbi:Benzoate 4-monooxygenase OS=Aspergillus niger GN=bphA PE=1 SV=1 [Rhizoctonia solani AG-1 IB]|uniref:Benzoate 4-monooxygenase n=1 Tax=Thanatephorus cucumeris (strain AG1-IB / isolate 7/3/14) TaxID=1108050 RepID=A0A0B7FLT5_THACB|nr:Benzoate 4-monooxygenase OS=Aspergillus niger GN=bphA PE=1 SV=1 [Rhizoctonia solani AG-1 IB]